MGGFPPTPEQADIVDAAVARQNLVVSACAGTGKTATLEMIAGHIAPRQGTFIAFGRDIAAEARSRFPSNVVCKTAHAFALAATPTPLKERFFAKRGAHHGKDVARILGITDGYRSEAIDLSPNQLGMLAREMKSWFCKSDSRDMVWQHLHPEALPGGCDAKEREHLGRMLLPWAKKIWSDTQSPNGVFKYSFEDYLKRYQLSSPRLPGDIILFDEAQDASRVIADIVRQQTNAQKIFVGDEMQAIMGFTGAVNAMAGHDGRRLALTQSFRFGPHVAAVANLFLSMLGADLRVKGFEPIKSRLTGIAAPDAILCRSNGGVIGEVMEQLKIGRRVATPGDGAEIRALAQAAMQLQAGQATEHPELFMFKKWEDVKEHCDTDPSAKGLKVFVKIVDDFGAGAIMSMTERLVKIGGKRTDPYDVLVTTAHKSKGLQFPKVRIGDDFPAPSEDPDDEFDDAELMLAYVAVTRAQHELSIGSLGWVLCPPPTPTPQERNEIQFA